MVRLPVLVIFNVHADVDACDCAQGMCEHRNRDRTLKNALRLREAALRISMGINSLAAWGESNLHHRLFKKVWIHVILSADNEEETGKSQVNGKGSLGR